METDVASVKDIVLGAIKDINEDLDLEQFENPGDDTPLYGDESELDSLSLVMLVGETEARINDAFDKAIVIASEKAMSMRNSPFRSVGALVEFIEAELAEA